MLAASAASRMTNMQESPRETARHAHGGDGCSPALWSPGGLSANLIMGLNPVDLRATQTKFSSWTHSCRDANLSGGGLSSLITSILRGTELWTDIMKCSIIKCACDLGLPDSLLNLNQTQRHVFKCAANAASMARLR